MQKLLSKGSGGRITAIVLPGSMFVLSLVTFGMLYSASQADNYPREIIAALIGTLMAAVITTLLLRYQTAGEEMRERNVEVFKKKVEVYDSFIETALLHLGDWSLSKQEIQELRRSIYKMSLISSVETINIVTAFIRGEALGEHKTDFNEIVNAFRFELSLEPLDHHYDMEAIDAHLRDEVDAESARVDRAALSDLMEQICRALANSDPILFDGLEIDEPEGNHGGTVVCATLPSGMLLVLENDYGKSLNQVAGWIDFESLPKARILKMKSQASSLHFLGEEEDTTAADFIVNGSEKAIVGEVSAGRVVWTIKQLVAGIVALERSASEATKDRSIRGDF